jgi:hypothetical protein
MLVVLVMYMVGIAARGLYGHGPCLAAVHAATLWLPDSTVLCVWFRSP